MGRICLDYMFYSIQCVSMIRSYKLNVPKGAKITGAWRREYWEKGSLSVWVGERVSECALKSLLLLDAVHFPFYSTLSHSSCLFSITAVRICRTFMLRTFEYIRFDLIWFDCDGWDFWHRLCDHLYMLELISHKMNLNSCWLTKSLSSRSYVAIDSFAWQTISEYGVCS